MEEKIFFLKWSIFKELLSHSYLLLGKAGVGVGAEHKKKMADEQYYARCYSQILLIKELEKSNAPSTIEFLKILNWTNKSPILIIIGILIVSHVLMALFLKNIFKIS